MVLPSFHRIVWPLASAFFGFDVDNNGVVVDLAGPFDSERDSPAQASGLAVGDRIDLKQMNCWAPGSPVCAALVTVLGGSAGSQETFPGRTVDLIIRPATGGASRVVHLHAKLAPLDLSAGWFCSPTQSPAFSRCWPSPGWSGPGPGG